MEQRRLRPGDVVDDYCPRERRLTDHAVVALLDDAVQQVRCVSCEAEHEYRHARVPAPRQRRDDEAGDAPTPAPAPPALVPPAPAVAAASSAPAPDEPVEPEPPIEREESALPMIARRRGDALSRHAFPGWKEQEAEATRPPRHLPDFTVRQPGSGNGRHRGRGRGQGGAQPQGPMRTGQFARDHRRPPHDGQGPGDGQRQGQPGGQGRRRRRRGGRRKPPQP